MGILNDTENIPAGSHSYLPLWMVMQLDLCGLISSELPEIYNEQQRRRLKADEDSVFLGGIYKYYFITGFKLNAMINLNADKFHPLGDFLFEIFLERFIHILRSLQLSP